MYPNHLIDSVINKFITSRVAADQSKQHTDDVIRIAIPYKDQDAAVSVKRQLRDLSSKVGKAIQPVLNVLFIYSSVTCVMQVMLGIQRATFTRALRDTVKRRHQSASITTKNITLLFRTIS